MKPQSRLCGNGAFCQQRSKDRYCPIADSLNVSDGVATCYPHIKCVDMFANRLWECFVKKKTTVQRKKNPHRVRGAGLAEMRYWPQLTDQLANARPRKKQRISLFYKLRIRNYTYAGSLKWRVQEGGRITRLIHGSSDAEDQ